MAGPPANPFSRKSLSGANGEWVTLPADGYDGDLPSWPLHNDPSTAEEALWMDLWRTPQAAMWAESGFERVVARYVMVTVLSETEPTAAMLSGDWSSDVCSSDLLILFPARAFRGLMANGLPCPLMVMMAICRRGL